MAEEKSVPTEDPLKVYSPPTLSPSIRSSSPNSNVRKCSVKLVDIHGGGGGGPGAVATGSGCAAAGGSTPAPAPSGPPVPFMSASSSASASAAAAGLKRDVSKLNNALDDEASSPAAKKAREIKADPPPNVGPGKPCPPQKESAWLTDKSMEKSASNLESIVPPGGKLTISPARLKEKSGGAASTGASPSSAVAASPASERPQSLPGAVTITKLSTGTSQQVESKDLKNLLSGPDGKVNSGSNGLRVPPSPAEGGGSAKKSSNSYSVQKQKKLQQQQLHNNQHMHQAHLQHDSAGGGGSDISCAKCKQAFSTKEAMRLHTCNSILDSQYLTDSADRHRMMVGGSHSATSSSNADSKSSSPGSGSSLSRSSSRSNSPLLNNHCSAAAVSRSQQQQQQHSGGGPPPPQPPQEQQQLHPTLSQLHKSASEGKVSRAGLNSDAGPCKVIKDERENKLMIEGRPKLSVSKVGGSRGPESGWQKQKKLEGGDSRAPTAAAASSSSAAHALGAGVKRKTNEGSGGGPPPGMQGPGPSPGAGGSKDWPKIRIKVGGMSIAAGGGGGETSSSGSGPVVKAIGGGKPAMIPGGRKAEEEGPFSFTFNGKPTYSPSRVEPSQPNQDKGKG